MSAYLCSDTHTCVIALYFARERAAAIGFKAPQSIALATDAKIDAAAAIRAYRALHG